MPSITFKRNVSQILIIHLQILFWKLYSTNTISDAFTTKPSTVSFPFVNHNENHLASSQLILNQDKISDKTSLFLSSTTIESETVTKSKPSNLEIVLFGIGDLRISDHEGLNKALMAALENKNSETKILPLFIFSTKDMLPNLPGLPAYTMNLATMVSSALSSLSQELKSQYNLDLEIHRGETVEDILDQILSDSGELSTTRMHVCNLGEADSQMGYNPYVHVTKLSEKNNMTIEPWSCELRNDPLEKIQGSDINSFPDTFIDYSKMYCESSVYDVSSPIASIDMKGKEELDLQFKLGNSKTDIPTAETVLSIFETTLNDYVENSVCQKQMEQAKNSGLYGTHWGGINNSMCSEADALKLLNEYTQVCGGDDNQFLSSPYYKEKIYRNKASLEHASIAWMGASSTQSDNDITGDKLIQGEMIIRYLAAPLLLGCISKRQIYHAGKNMSRETDWSSKLKQAFFGEEASVLEQFIENREWQDLFAAKNIIKQKENNDLKCASGKLDFQYWRWNGFLCRYAVSDLVSTSSEFDAESVTSPPSSIVLVHGFGASGAQWKRAVGELAAQNKVKDVATATLQPRFGKAFAPDLIGFGQSEKPALTYTQYLWESYISTFVREITLQKYKNEKFIVGGNSIGGYTSMGCAADDTLTDMEGKVSGSGGPGTGRCDGLVLMNSAGKILTEEDVKKSMIENDGRSIAELTSGNLLDPCGAPPRTIAKIGGEALLSYLRPRIKSITVPLYPSNPTNVDDNLCDNILRDSLDPGAINVMISGSKLPPPRTANELLSARFGAATTSRTQTNGDSNEIKEGQWKGPVLVTQGMKDPLNDATGRAKMLGELRDGIEIYPLMEGGHCPHDELPEDVIKGIMQWMEKRENTVDDVMQTVKKTDSVLDEEVKV